MRKEKKIKLEWKIFAYNHTIIYILDIKYKLFKNLGHFKGAV